MYVVEAAGRNQYPGHGFPVIVQGGVSSKWMKHVNVRFDFWMNSDFCGKIWSYPLVNEHSHGKSPRNVIYVSIYRDGVSQCAESMRYEEASESSKCLALVLWYKYHVFYFLSRLQFSVCSRHGSGLDVFKDVNGGFDGLILDSWIYLC